MTLARWYHSLVRTRPDLYRAIYDFNAYPHRWVHASWLETPAPAVLEAHPHTRRRLSASYCQHFGLTETHWDFTAPSTRLALLPANSVLRLAHTVGATRLAHRLARVIARDERRDVIAAIGETAFAYALRRARPLTSTEVPASETNSTSSLTDDIFSAGWYSLTTVIGAEPPAVQQRFRLKLPRSLELADTSSDATAAEEWKRIQAIAQEILSPEELRCLA